MEGVGIKEGGRVDVSANQAEDNSTRAGEEYIVERKRKKPGGGKRRERGEKRKKRKAPTRSKVELEEKKSFGAGVPRTVALQ